MNNLDTSINTQHTSLNADVTLRFEWAHCHKISVPLWGAYAVYIQFYLCHHWVYVIIYKS